MLLRKSGISQQGLADFFRRVLREEGKYENDGQNTNSGKSQEKDDRLSRTLDMFSTHPPTEERAEHIRMSASYPSTPALSAEDWRAFKSICATTAPLTPPAEDEAANR